MLNTIDVNKIDDYLLLQSDCMDVLKNIPDGSIELILCDPPYNLAKYSTGNMKFDWRSEINNDVANWDLKELSPADFIDEFKRVLSPTGNIFIFTSYNLIGKWHEVFDSEFDTFQFMVWHKTNPIPNIRKSSFLNSCELIVCMWNKGHTWNFSKQNEMHNFIESPICMGGERLKDPKHPTQKPLSILKHIIKIASSENDLVLDMFMGVGSTGVAARELNRRFLGVEIETNYFEASEKRIKAAEEKRILAAAKEAEIKAEGNSEMETESEIEAKPEVKVKSKTNLKEKPVKASKTAVRKDTKAKATKTAVSKDPKAKVTKSAASKDTKAEVTKTAVSKDTKAKVTKTAVSKDPKAKVTKTVKEK